MSTRELRLSGFFAATFALLSGAAWAGGGAPVLSVPTLDEFALAGMAAVLGIAGVLAIWRRKK